MASMKPINVGTSKRLESLFSTFKGKATGKIKLHNREASLGTFNTPSLNYSSTVLSVDPTKRYK